MCMKNVDGKFIYVFSFDSRDKLANAGFDLIKSDEKNSIFVFANQPDEFDVLDAVSFIASNKLTF